MAIIRVCDRCGKQSPDKDDRHIANHWFTVKIKKVGTLEGSYETDRLLCKTCYNELRDFIEEEE